LVCAGADLDELHLFLTDMHGQRAVKGARRRRQRDAGEVETAHHLMREGGAFAEHPVIRHHRCEELRRGGFDLGGAMLGRDDRRRVRQLIAEIMVGIAMRVEEQIDPCGGGNSGAHALQHHARQLQIHQRVDEERLSAIGHQTGIAPTPSAVGLKIGVATIADVVQTLRIRPAHRLAPTLVVADSSTPPKGFRLSRRSARDP
jgi:hypothetical protein